MVHLIFYFYALNKLPSINKIKYHAYKNNCSRFYLINHEFSENKLIYYSNKDIDQSKDNKTGSEEFFSEPDNAL
jgi:hypothetical protein